MSACEEPRTISDDRPSDTFGFIDDSMPLATSRRCDNRRAAQALVRFLNRETRCVVANRLVLHYDKRPE